MKTTQQVKKEKTMIKTSDRFIEICKKIVADYYMEHTDVTDEVSCPEVYVVWYCKTLQNHKALLSTTALDGMYYEMTYNGDKSQLYLDAYKKFENKCYEVRE